MDRIPGSGTKIFLCRDETALLGALHPRPEMALLLPSLKSVTRLSLRMEEPGGKLSGNAPKDGSSQARDP